MVAVGVGLAGGLLRVLTADAVEEAARPPADADAGLLIVDVRDASSDRPLPARVTITPRALFADARILIGGAGSVRTPLPSGSYRVSVTHGPEWSFAERRVDVADGATARIAAPLTRLVDGNAYTACDLHVHTAESPDSDVGLRERAHTLVAEDVHFAVITDHNHVTQASSALDAVGVGSLPGVEITTWAPEFGHFNAFPQAAAPTYTRTDPARLLGALRSVPDTFVQVNHPRLERHIGYFELSSFDRTTQHDEAAFPFTFDAIEVWNGYDLGAPARRDEVFRDFLALIARGMRVSATGGSDSHRAALAPFVGYPRTYVHVPRAQARESARVLAALKRGRSFVSNGPLIDLRVGDLGAGDTMRPAHGERFVSAELDVRAPAYMQLSEVEVWADDRLVSRASLAPPSTVTDSFQRTLRLRVPIAGAHALIATVRGLGSLKPLLGHIDATPYAFTNPLWIAAP